MKELQREYTNIEFYDFNYIKEISSNNKLYCDLEHLNYSGAELLSTYIAKNVLGNESK